MKPLLGLALLLAGIAYPFWVYAMLSHGHANTAWIMLPLVVLWLLRTIFPGAKQPDSRLQPALALIGCLILALAGSAHVLRWYPVLVSVIMLAVFGSSLLHGQPMIERMARLRHPNLPPVAVRHTRKVTQVWVAFFLCNGLIAAALALWAPWSWWTAYNGGISYILVGLLSAGEWLLRPRIETVS